MESLDPEKLQTVLAQLRDADVSQFRYKDNTCEIFIDFFSEEEEEEVPVAEGPHVGFHVPDTSDDDEEFARRGRAARDGYHELFGKNVPKFSPAKRG